MRQACIGFLFLTVLGPPQGFPAEEGEKAHPAAPVDAPDVNLQDSKALLDAGTRYEERGHSAWAELCYKQILKLGERPECGEAAFRLASMDLRRGRHEKAYARLREVAGKYGHAGARALLAKAENEATRRQRQLVNDADRAFGAGKHEEARKLYVEAYDLAPDRISAAAFVPRREIVPRIARCVDLIDDASFKEKIQPVERSISACKRCAQGGGFEKCAPCKGTGIVETVIRGISGSVRIRKDPCGRCSEVGWLFCNDCYGLESATGKGKLNEREMKALAGVVNKVRALPVLRMRLDAALREVEKVLLGVDEAAALTFFRAIKPRYSLSGDLKSAIGTVPPEKDAIRQASPRWAAPADALRRRANFLLGYACDYARYIRQFDMLRAARKKDKPKLSEPPSASLHLPSEPVGPEILSAFPEQNMAAWRAVKGTLVKYTEDGDDFAKGRLHLAGDLPHNVSFCVWRPEAAKHLERLEKGTPWSARVEGLAKAYPFGVREKALQAPAGRRAIVVGRFLRDPLGYPRNWFEVWDLKVGLTPDQEKLLHALEEPVDVVFPALELRKLASFLKVWYGVAVDLDGVDRDAIVACEAVECPIGTLLGEVARCLGCGWYARKGVVVLARDAPSGAAADAEAVLAELASSARGNVKVVVKRMEASPGTSTGAPAAAEKLPDNIAALREAISKALTEMRYGLAEKCCEGLLAKARDAEDHEKVRRLRNRLRLFQAMTESIPVSRLAGATDLSRIRIQNPAGGVHVETVRVLRRGADYLVIQPSYGGEAQVRSAWIRSEEPLGAVEWRAQKKAEMDALSAEAESATPRERVQKRFFLALAAKTNGFPELGTSFLEKAASENELEWLIATYFPARLEELRACWRSATGREAPAVAATAPVPPPENLRPGTGLRVDEPLPVEASQLYPYAKKHLMEGRVFLSRALPGMEDAQKSRKIARDHFEAARTGLDKFLEGKPGDLDAIQLKREVTMMIQTCVKDLGFFD